MVSVAPLSLRVSHSFTSRSRICRDTDMASVGTGAAWVALCCHRLCHPPSTIPARTRTPSGTEGTFCFLGERPPIKHLGCFGTAATGSRAGTCQWCQGHLPGEDCTWLNPTEMRQSLEPIQSNRESLLLSCPGTLCKAGDRAVSIAASHAGHVEGLCASPAVIVICPGAEHVEPSDGSQLC